MTDPRFPNLFIIGAPKCGTTTLHSALSAAPGVFMSFVKEPAFFNTERHFRRGVPEYLNTFFAGAARFPLRGEATPWYLYGPQVPGRLYEASAGRGLKLVVLLRQPTDRAYSMYLDQRRAGLETRSFDQAVAEELARPEPDPPGLAARRYIWASRYSRHLQAWQAVFGADSMKVYLTEDLRTPVEFWEDLSAFLDADLGPERLTNLSWDQTNASAGRRWPWLDRVLFSTHGREGYVLAAARRAMPARWYRSAAQSMSRWNQAAVDSLAHPPSAALLSSLDLEFRSEVRTLEQLVGRSLAHWLPENRQRD